MANSKEQIEQTIAEVQGKLRRLPGVTAQTLEQVRRIQRDWADVVVDLPQQPLRLPYSSLPTPAELRWK